MLTITDVAWQSETNGTIGIVITHDNISNEEKGRIMFLPFNICTDQIIDAKIVAKRGTRLNINIAKAFMLNQGIKVNICLNI